MLTDMLVYKKTAGMSLGYSLNVVSELPLNQLAHVLIQS